MSTAKFRGQVLDGPKKGEWVYGSYLEFTVRGVKHARIIPMFDCKEEYFGEALDDTMEITIDCISVDPNTVGQYVWLNDKNHKEIYTDDKINITWSDFYEGDYYYDQELVGVVQFDAQGAEAILEKGSEIHADDYESDGSGNKYIGGCTCVPISALNIGIGIHEHAEYGYDSKLDIEVIGNIHDDKNLITQ